MPNSTTGGRKNNEKPACGKPQAGLLSRGSSFSLSLCSNRRNRVTINTVIARPEGPWQSPGRMLDAVKHSKYGTFWLALLYLCTILVLDCAGRLPRRGVAPPRNDTVVGSWPQRTNCAINPNFAALWWDYWLIRRCCCRAGSCRSVRCHPQ